MKNKFIWFILVILVFGSSLLQLKAQEYHEFAPIGAKWWYESSSIDTYIESVRDTILEEQHGKVLKIERQTKDGIDLKTWEVIVYQDKNTVYYYVQDQFQVLFDFEITEYESCHSEFSPTISVWQEEPIIVNGVELSKFNAIYNTIFFSVNFTLVEKIGGNLFLSCISPELENIGDLKCYEDNEIGYFCDENLWTEIEETNSVFSINVYPNPSVKEFIVEVNHIHFKNNNNSYIEVIDKMGKSINRIYLKQNTQKYYLKNSDLVEGVYFISLTINGLLTSNEKIIIL